MVCALNEHNSGLVHCKPVSSVLKTQFFSFSGYVVKRVGNQNCNRRLGIMFNMDISHISHAGAWLSGFAPSVRNIFFLQMITFK